MTNIPHSSNSHLHTMLTQNTSCIYFQENRRVYSLPSALHESALRLFSSLLLAVLRPHLLTGLRDFPLLTRLSLFRCPISPLLPLPPSHLCFPWLSLSPFFACFRELLPGRFTYLSPTAPNVQLHPFCLLLRVSHALIALLFLAIHAFLPFFTLLRHCCPSFPLSPSYKLLRRSSS